MDFTRNLRFELALGLRRAPTYPEAAVDLEEMQHGLNVYLRALAGSCQQKVVTDEGIRRGILPRGVRSSATGRTWSGGIRNRPICRNRSGGLRAGSSIATFTTGWRRISPLTSQQPPRPLSAGLTHLLQGVLTSAEVLRRYPGLRSRYLRLCRTCLAERAS